MPQRPPSRVKMRLPVEVRRDVLHAHRPGRAVAFQGKPVDQPHRVGVQRVDLQLLLDLRAALLGRDDAVADGRQGAVPEALARVLLQGAQDMLGVFLGLVFVEQRHDLPHHDVHGIVAHLLGDRDQPDAVLRQLADVEFQFEMVAEEAAERMDDHDIERRGLAGSRLDHALEFGAAVVGGGCARFDVGLGELVAARLAIRLALPLLVRDRDIMLGLPRRRDAQIEGGAQRHGHRGNLLTSSRRPEQFVEKITEPRFEYVDFGVRDRHARGPIVDDAPRLNVVFDRAAKARPGTGHDIKIGRQFAECGAVAQG